jgi:alkylmercury lyase
LEVQVGTRKNRAGWPTGAGGRRGRVPRDDLGQLTRPLDVWARQTLGPPAVAGILRTLLTELVSGVPVAVDRLAAASGQPATQVTAILRGLGAEWDPDGRVAGLGMTLRPTEHQVRLDGQVVWAWCALDGLAVPLLLDTPAEVRSRCPATGLPVRVTVSPQRVRDLDPPGAVVSQILTPPQQARDLRQHLCDRGRFFASAGAAAGWAARHPDGLVAGVPEAVRQLGSIVPVVTGPPRLAAPGAGPL